MRPRERDRPGAQSGPGQPVSCGRRRQRRCRVTHRSAASSPHQCLPDPGPSELQAGGGLCRLAPDERGACPFGSPTGRPSRASPDFNVTKHNEHYRRIPQKQPGPSRVVSSPFSGDLRPVAHQIRSEAARPPACRFIDQESLQALKVWPAWPAPFFAFCAKPQAGSQLSLGLS
jgi:hypothetical protein